MQGARSGCGARVKYKIRLFLRESAFRFPSQCSDEDEDDDDQRDDNSINLRAQNERSDSRFRRIFTQKMSFKFIPESLM